MIVGIVALEAVFLLRDAPGPHRHQPRDRVRAAQRHLPAPHPPLRALLPGPSHRRPHEPRHQRPLRGAHGAGPRDHVHRQHGRHLRRDGPGHGPYLAAAPPALAGPAPLRVRARALFRPPHPRPLRVGPGAAQRDQRHRAGEPLRSAGRAGLRPGAVRDGALPGRQRGVPAPQPPAHPHVRQPLPGHPAPHGRGGGPRPVAGRAHGGAGHDHHRRVRGLRRLPGHAALADDRARLGGEHLRARRGLHGTPGRDPLRRPRDRRPRARRRHRHPRRRGHARTSPSPTTTRPVLHDINLEVRAGSTVAIVGPTGSGKSTLVSLIPRLFEAPAGTVFVDGHDVRDLPSRDPARGRRLRSAGDVPLLGDGGRERRLRDPGRS